MAQLDSSHSERDLDDVLRDHTIVIPQDGRVWDLSQYVWTLPVHSNTPPCACRACRGGGAS